MHSLNIGYLLHHEPGFGIFPQILKLLLLSLHQYDYQTNEKENERPKQHESARNDPKHRLIPTRAAVSQDRQKR
jgi:hypothetical protein